MTSPDWVLCGLLCAFTLTLCAFRSHNRLPWPDEVLGYRVVGAPSFGQMWRGWWEGADGGGPVYYLLAGLWVGAFGVSELTLRLLSATGMAAALVLIWVSARRYFPTLAVAFSVGLLFFTPPVMIWEEVSGRFYGTFLAFAALASLWFLQTAEAELTTSDLVITAVAQACLVGSHILGLVYSVALVAGMIVLDRWSHRLRPSLYLSAASGWLVLPISWHAIHASTSIARKTFWTRKPDPFDLVFGWTVYGKWALLVLATLGLVALLQLCTRRLQSSIPTSPRMPSAAVGLAGSLLLAQLLLFTKSQFGLSIYSDRYLLPLSIPAVLVLAALFSRVVPRAAVAPARKSFIFALSAVLLLPSCAYAASHNIYAVLYPPPGYMARVTARIPKGAPVLVTLLPPFTLLSTFDHSHQYFFLLDWSYDLDPRHQGGDLSGQRLMENWKRAGYEPDHILSCHAVLARYPDLYLLLDPGRTPWLRDRLQDDPDFQVQELATFPEWEPLSLWSIHRKGPGIPC